MDQHSKISLMKAATNYSLKVINFLILFFFISSIKDLPNWLTFKLPTSEKYFQLKKQLSSSNLHTVCQEAKCPNIGECWNDENGPATATIMVIHALYLKYLIFF